MKYIFNQTQIRKLVKEEKEVSDKIFNHILDKENISKSSEDESKFVNEKGIVFFSVRYSTLIFNHNIVNLFDKYGINQFSDLKLLNWFNNKFGTNFDDIIADDRIGPGEFGYDIQQMWGDEDHDVENSQSFQAWKRYNTMADKFSSERTKRHEEIRKTKLERADNVVRYLKSKFSNNPKIIRFQVMDANTILIAINGFHYRSYIIDGELEMDKTHELFTFFKNLVVKNFGEDYNYFHYDFMILWK